MGKYSEFSIEKISCPCWSFFSATQALLVSTQGQIKVQDKTLTFKMLGVRRFLVPLLKIRVYRKCLNEFIHPHIHGHVGKS